MRSFEYVFNSSSERYADVGYASHWFWIAVAELFGLSGLILIVVVGLALVRDPRLFKSFATLCAAQSISDAIVVSWITFVILPILAIRDPILPFGILDYLTSAVACFYMLEVWIITVITIDRYCAICKPFIYERMFTVEKCQLYVLAGVFYAAFNLITMGPCPPWIDVEHYMTSYNFNETADGSSPCGNTVTIFTFIQAGPVMITGIVMSLLSVYELRKRERSLDDRTKKIEQLGRKRGVLMTSVYNLCYQAVAMCVFNIGGPIALAKDYKILLLYLTTVNWMSQHMFNSWALLIHNPSVRKTLRKMLGVKKLGEQVSRTSLDSRLTLSKVGALQTEF